MVSVLFATIQSCVSRRKSPARWLAGVAFALGACSLVGCDRSPGAIGAVDVADEIASDGSVSASSNRHPGLGENGDTYASASQRFEHDAGLTLAGNVVSHSFTIANSWGEDVSIHDEEHDIIVNCGCTKFFLAKYQLAPGESTTVDVSLDTGRRSGAINKGGEIIWTAADGTRYSTKFTITGEIKSAFEAEPTALSFGADDVKLGTVKEIRLKSSFPIDWKSVTASSASEAFRVVACEGFEDGATCRVECVARGDVETAQAALRFAARGLSRGGVISLQKCRCVSTRFWHS